ncbi:MAG TPA: hypothetical protein VFR03_02270 [Thermoanaerobaculia bacterium]|nr:hypothetical protein [Thermoanaerobaculia bacterium]
MSWPMCGGTTIDGDAVRRAGTSGRRPSPEELISMQAQGRLGR